MTLNFTVNTNGQVVEGGHNSVLFKGQVPESLTMFSDYIGNQNWTLFFFFCSFFPFLLILIFLLFLEGDVVRVGGWVCKDREMSVIRMHDVKFLENK